MPKAKSFRADKLTRRSPIGQSLFRTCVYLCFFAILQSCGQNPGESAPAATDSVVDDNRLPVLSDLAPVSHLSGSAELVASVQATDADGDSISFSLAGPDAGFFRVSNGGEIRFSEAPRFIKPMDSDLDNRYELSVLASDSVGSTSKPLVVEVVDAVFGLASPPILKLARIVSDQDFRAYNARCSISRWI